MSRAKVPQRSSPPVILLVSVSPLRIPPPSALPGSAAAETEWSPRRLTSHSSECQFSSSPPWHAASLGRTYSLGRSSEAEPALLATLSCLLRKRSILLDDRWRATSWRGGTLRFCRSSRPGSRCSEPRSSRRATAESTCVRERVMGAVAGARVRACHACRAERPRPIRRPVGLAHCRLAASQVTATAR